MAVGCTEIKEVLDKKNRGSTTTSVATYLTVMNMKQWTTGALVPCLLLRATLQPVVQSQYFSHTTVEKKEVKKSLSVMWLLN